MSLLAVVLFILLTLFVVIETLGLIRELKERKKKKQSATSHRVVENNDKGEHKSNEWRS